MRGMLDNKKVYGWQSHTIYWYIHMYLTLRYLTMRVFIVPGLFSLSLSLSLCPLSFFLSLFLSLSLYIYIYCMMTYYQHVYLHLFLTICLTAPITIPTLGARSEPHGLPDTSVICQVTLWEEALWATLTCHCLSAVTHTSSLNRSLPDITLL